MWLWFDNEYVMHMKGGSRSYGWPGKILNNLKRWSRTLICYKKGIKGFKVNLGETCSQFQGGDLGL